MKLSHKDFLSIWPAGTPGLLANPTTPLPNEHIPTLCAYLPPASTATGASCIICPGGGYRHLADHEGEPVAELLAARGITSFVLRYRLGPHYVYPVALHDAQQAVRFVRAHAAEWQLDPELLGILGFSAGGHLASMVATHFSEMAGTTVADSLQPISARPDLQILIYPVISFHETYEPVAALLAYDLQPSPALLDELSSEQHVSPATPPAFLVHTTNDLAVSIKNSDMYAASLQAAGVPYEYVRGDFGAHGFGLRDQWVLPCLAWLTRTGFARP